MSINDYAEMIYKDLERCKLGLEIKTKEEEKEDGRKDVRTTTKD